MSTIADIISLVTPYLGLVGGVLLVAEGIFRFSGLKKKKFTDFLLLVFEVLMGLFFMNFIRSPGSQLEPGFLYQPFFMSENDGIIIMFLVAISGIIVVVSSFYDLFNRYEKKHKKKKKDLLLFFSKLLIGLFLVCWYLIEIINYFEPPESLL